MIIEKGGVKNHMKNTFIFELNKEKMIFFILIIIQFITMIASVVTPLMNGRFLDLLISNIDFYTLFKYAMLIISIGVISSLLTYIYNILSIKLKNKIAFELNIKVINHLHKISMRKFEEFNVAYLNQRINNDAATISNFFFDNFMVMIINVIQFILLIFFLLRINLPFFLLVIFFIPVYVIVYMLLKKPLYINGLQYKESQNIFFDKLNEQFELNREIKIHSIIAKADVALRKNYNGYLSSLMKLAKVSNLFNSIDSIICLLFQAITLLIGGLMVINKNITLGEYSILNIYFTAILGIIKYFFGFAKNYQDYKISNIRMNNLLNIPEDFVGNLLLDEINNIQISVNDIKKFFKKGNLITIYGRNGSGKTTFFYKLIGVIGGINTTVKYDNQYIETLDLYNIRKTKISCMIQNEKVGNMLAIEYLYENLKVNSLNDLNKIFDERGLTKLVSNEKFNLHSLADKPINGISDGEKQIIILLKTLAMQFDVLILDEPTSNLNEFYTNLIIDYLKKIRSNKIVIVITHDKSFLEVADEVVEII